MKSVALALALAAAAWAILDHPAPRVVKLAQVVIDGQAADVLIYAVVNHGMWTIPVVGPTGHPASFTVYWIAEGKKSLLQTVSGVYTGEWKFGDHPQTLTNKALQSLLEE